MATGFAVIGTGLWGESHARVYAEHPGAKLVAVCDVNAERAEEVGRRYGAAKILTDYTEAIACDAVEAVSVATPDFAHFQPVMAALAAKKHVLVEKPMATSLEEAERIAEAVARAGVTFMVDFHNRWNPAMHAAKLAVERGDIGVPCMAYVRMHDTIYVPTKMLSWAARSSPLWFLGCHTFDLLRFILGDEADTVYCVSRSRVLKEKGVDTPDHFTCTFQFKGGATAVMENAWILPETEPAIIDFKLELFGSEGAIYADISHNRTLQLYTKEKATYPNMLTAYEVYGETKGFVFESIRAFADCVIHARRPPVGVEDGLLNTRACCAAERSAREGVPVRI